MLHRCVSQWFPLLAGTFTKRRPASATVGWITAGARRRCWLPSYPLFLASLLHVLASRSPRDAVQTSTTGLPFLGSLCALCHSRSSETIASLIMGSPLTSTTGLLFLVSLGALCHSRNSETIASLIMASPLTSTVGLPFLTSLLHVTASHSSMRTVPYIDCLPALHDVSQGVTSQPLPGPGIHP